MRGVEEIADFLGWSRRTTYHALSAGHLKGVFKVGQIWCARRSTLAREIARLEGQAA